MYEGGILEYSPFLCRIYVVVIKVMVGDTTYGKINDEELKEQIRFRYLQVHFHQSLRESWIKKIMKLQADNLS